MGWRIGLNQSEHMINGLLAIKTHVDASCEGGAGRPMVVHNEEIKHIYIYITKPHVAHDSQNGWTCFKQFVLDESTYLGTGFQHCRFQAMVRKKDGLEHSSHKRDMASFCAARSSRASLSRGYCNKNVILSTKPSSQVWRASIAKLGITFALCPGAQIIIGKRRVARTTKCACCHWN